MSFHPSVRVPIPDELTRTAFRDLHGRHLHGFALLVTLGDRPRAARLTADALRVASEHVAELQHPERAAAWLRRRVLLRARPRRGVPAAGAAEVLAEIGASAPMVAGLSALSTVERAAIIAADIEGVEIRDVGSIVDRLGGRLDRLLIRSRRRYAAAYAEAAPHEPSSGPLADRIRDAARRAMS